MGMIVKGVIDRFEEKKAVIKTDDGAEIIWPIKNLPDEMLSGDAVTLTLSPASEETANQQSLAKKMLNEILDVPESSQTN